MIKELLDQRADVAIADLTITYNREQVVDFTMPFMNLGISVLYRKPIKQPPNLFSFLSPLSLDVWCYMAVSVHRKIFFIAQFKRIFMNPFPVYFFSLVDRLSRRFNSPLHSREVTFNLKFSSQLSM